MAALGVVGAVTPSALAATTGPGSPAPRPNVAGTYNGRVDQVQPKPYTGHIHFVVKHGELTGLRFRVGTLCGVAWAVAKDQPPNFSVKVSSTGAFSYDRTVGGRQIKLKGTLKHNKARGTFFTAFTAGQNTCTMGKPASFTATR